MLLLHAASAQAPVTPAALWHSWHAEPTALALVAISGALYAVGYRRLQRRGARHAASHARAALFYAGLVTLWLALGSPLDALAESLFAGHMLQHVVLIAVAAPLVVLGVPLVPVLWGLPPRARRTLGRAWNAARLPRLFAWLTTPLVAWGVHAVALWGWHLPGPYTAALAHPTVHALEHASFFATALLMWWVTFRPLYHPRDTGAGAIGVAFGTLMQSAALGALMTFSTSPWYPVQSSGAAAWGLTPLTDQQLAGLIMWIPPGFVYLAAILALVYRWVRASPVEAGPAALGNSAARAAGPPLSALH